MMAITPTDEPNVAATHAKAVPRLGFLGVGWIGRARMKALAESGDARVAAIADAVPDVVGDVRKDLGESDVVCCATLDELLAQKLDGVVIATPSALHAEQAIAALEHGMPVFCQKPLARTADETRNVIAAARANNVLLGVDLSYRHTEGMRRIRELVRAGELGKVYAVDLVFHNAYGPAKPWFFDPTLSGGGCVIDLGTHLVDLALWTLGHPAIRRCSSRLFANGASLDRRAAKCEDYATAHLDLERGVSIQLACSWNLHAGQDAVISATFYGTRGGASLKNVGGSFYDFEATLARGTHRESLSAPPDDWGGRAAVTWARRLSRSPSYDGEIEGLVEVATAIDRIYGR